MSLYVRRLGVAEFVLEHRKHELMHRNMFISLLLQMGNCN